MVIAYRWYLNTVGMRRLTRKEQTAQTRERLLAAASRQFLAQGFHSASLADIAADAGYTKGALFAHFKSKEDLFFVLLEERLDAMIEVLDAIRPTQPTPRAIAREMAATWRNNIDKERAWSLLVLEFRVYAARDPAAAERYAAVHQRHAEALERLYQRYLAEAGASTELSPRALAHAGMAIYHGVTLEELAQPGLRGEAIVEALAMGLMETHAREEER